jgi:hypothetical protein
MQYPRANLPTRQLSYLPITQQASVAATWKHLSEVGNCRARVDVKLQVDCSIAARVISSQRATQNRLLAHLPISQQASVAATWKHLSEVGNCKARADVKLQVDCSIVACPLAYLPTRLFAHLQITQPTDIAATWKDLSEVGNCRARANVKLQVGYSIAARIAMGRSISQETEMRQEPFLHSGVNFTKPVRISNLRAI